MARKAYQYMEISFPDSILEQYASPIGALKNLLADYINETNDKGGKVCKDFVFGEVKTYAWKENLGAFSIEFNNERNRKTYYHARENFSNWLEARNIVTVHSVGYDLPYGALGLKPNPDLDGTLGEKAMEYIMITLPTARGFESE